MPVSKINESNPIRNNGGTIVYGTTRANGAVTNAPGKSVASKNEVRIKTIPDAASTGEQGIYYKMVAKPIAASSNYGTQIAGKYIILSYSREIGGVSTNMLNGSKNDQIRSINYKETIRSRQLSGKILNLYTGRYTTNIGSQVDEFKGLGKSLSDDAARSSMTFPGEFILMYGAKNDPQFQDYRARTD